jgi:hypothetical protein
LPVKPFEREFIRALIGRPVARQLAHAGAQPWFAYLTVCLLQLKVIWPDWQHRDLTGGDSASYFWSAVRWHDSGLVDLIWSPLYQVFCGALLMLSPDAYVVTMLHRWMIIFVGTALTLWLMRRLVPHAIAWLLAAWWALLGANYNVMYEVHLFGLLPLLLVLGLLTFDPGPWRRGVALAVLIGAAILIRNELNIAVVWLVVVFSITEARRRRDASGRWRSFVTSRILPYLAPLASTAIIVLALYSRAIVQFPELLAASEPKHTLNLCQVYAFGYEQRHDDWTKSPWLDCQTLMIRDFGQPLPSVVTAIRSNPSAMLEHFWWNIELAPSGLQVLLFNATSGAVTPDFASVTTSSPQAFVSSLIFLGLLVAGAATVFVDWRTWWTLRIQTNRFTWLCFFGLVCVAIPVIVFERPRPEYIYTLGILSLALVGIALASLGRRLVGLTNWAPIAIGVGVYLFVVISPYYADVSTGGKRPQLEEYRRLFPLASILKRSDTMLLAPASMQNSELYLGSHLGPSWDYGLLPVYAPAEDFDIFLARHRINLVYLDDTVLPQLSTEPGVQRFLRAPEASGWRVLTRGAEANRPWIILGRTSLDNVAAAS